MSLDDLPRVALARTPTPLHETTRLRDALGGPTQCPRLLFKRDDLTDLALGGNKARKLEYLLADAQARGATWLITTGGPQSNHARMTAAAARLCGMGATLILSGPGPRSVTGNLLLDRAIGAEIVMLDPALEGAELQAAETAALESTTDSLEQRGERPCTIVLGGSDALGSLGYVRATRELRDQLAELGIRVHRLYHASGSRGTQAGLELGARLFDTGYRITGIAVSGGEDEKRGRAVNMIRDAAALIGESITVDADELHTDQRYYGTGYAAHTTAAAEAITLVARTEGIFLDPVYTAKGMAGLIDHIRSGVIAATETVVFLHTGGAPGLFAMGETALEGG
jgi:D-cysteine desulfhydrase family pyridoxal phosphate-dependent enzyme